MKITLGTIVRLVTLILALINQILAIFGKGFSFTANELYQTVSLIFTVIASSVAAWKNNDVTYFARLAGRVLKALKEEEVSEEEVEQLVEPKE